MSSRRGEEMGSSGKRQKIPDAKVSASLDAAKFPVLQGSNGAAAVKLMSILISEAKDGAPLEELKTKVRAVMAAKDDEFHVFSRFFIALTRINK
jgi:hypothetical protein